MHQPGARYSNSWKVEVFSVKLADELRRFIPSICPHKKFVPDEILHTSKENQCAFLKGFAEDGGVSLKDNMIELNMKDEKLSIIIHLMLLNLGIVSKRRIYGGVFRISIYSENVNVFKELIGFVSDFKNNRLKSFSRKSSRKSFGFLRIMICKIMKDSGFGLSSKFDNLYNRDTCSVDLARRFVVEYREQCSEHELYKRMVFLLDNFYFDKVVDMKNNMDVKIPTLCFEMGEKHQFVQNGIISGNSQGSEWDRVLLFDDGFGGWGEMRQRWLYTGVTRSRQFLLIAVK